MADCAVHNSIDRLTLPERRNDKTDRDDSPVNRRLIDERSENCAATRWKSKTLLASLQKHLLKREKESWPFSALMSAKQKHD